MVDLEVKIEGMDELVARMSNVSHEVNYKGVRFALRRAANIVAKEAKQNAARLNDPKSASSIAENITVRWNPRLFKTTGNLGFRIGVLGGAGSTQKGKGPKGGDTRHWRHLEFGTRKMKAQPFMRPALQANEQAAIREFVIHAKKAIERAAKNAAKKAVV